MNNCEIVDNVACGRAFKYCRTHKVESKDCPGNAKPTEPQSQSAGLAAYQTYVNYVADAVARKREFKVGDKVCDSQTSPTLPESCVVGSGTYSYAWVGHRIILFEHRGYIHPLSNIVTLSRPGYLRGTSNLDLEVVCV